MCKAIKIMNVKIFFAFTINKIMLLPIQQDLIGGAVISDWRITDDIYRIKKKSTGKIFWKNERTSERGSFFS